MTTMRMVGTSHRRSLWAKVGGGVLARRAGGGVGEVGMGTTPVAPAMVGSSLVGAASRAARNSIGRGEPLGRVAGQGAQGDVLEALGDAGTQVAGAGRGLLQAGQRGGGIGGALERDPPGEALVEHDAEGVDVAAGVDRRRPRPARARGTGRCRSSSRSG